MRQVQQSDLDECKLRKQIKPPDYLGAPIGNTLGELRSKKLDLLSMKCTLENNKKPKVVFENSYFFRSCYLWNRLPLDLRETVCLESFKINLEKHMWVSALKEMENRNEEVR